MTKQKSIPQEDRCHWPRCKRIGTATASFDGLDGYRACDFHWEQYHRKVDAMLEELGQDWPNFYITASAGLHRLRVFYICPVCRERYGPFDSIAEARKIDFCCQKQDTKSSSGRNPKKPKFKV